MKPLSKTLSAMLATCLLAVCFVSTVAAQGNQPGTQPASEILRIRKMTDLNRDYRQRAIQLGNRSGRPRDWGVFDVSFDVGPEWVDEMTIIYTVMLQNDKAKPGEKALSLMTVTAMYSDVEQGRDRKAGVVVSPSALDRYGSPIGFAVQIFVAGQLAAEQGIGKGLLGNQQDWWKKPEIIDSQLVQKRDGYLVERSKSVFNLVDLDAYEAGK